METNGKQFGKENYEKKNLRHIATLQRLVLPILIDAAQRCENITGVTYILGGLNATQLQESRVGLDGL
jgi:hypothetical protein